MPLSSLLSAGAGAKMVSLFSLEYLILFLPVCLIIYSLLPKSWKKFFLLFASGCFFWFISGKLLVYLILSVFSMHYFGLWLDRIRLQMPTPHDELSKEERKKIRARIQTRLRTIVFLAAFLHIGVLLGLKYSGFFTSNINALFTLFKVPIQINIPTILVPIGISFFSLQALSYIMDVYHGVIKADENLFRLGLFLSFFPQIVEGPICRYKQTADQLWNAEPIRHANLLKGFQRILYGMIKKIIIADRLNPLVQIVFYYHKHCEGSVLVVGAICYTIQLYMDFSGSMDVVIGTAQIFGIELPENFKQPFFSKTISEFWQRWHITLGAWFKDYLFYPLTTSRALKKLTTNARKTLGNFYGPLLSGIIGLLCVWFCNGLWHGPAWHYIVFGLYHFFLIICGKLITPPIQWINTKLHINTNWKVYRFVQIIRTAIFVVIGEVIFRADGVRAALQILKGMTSSFSFKSWNDSLLLKLGVDRLDLIIVGITLLLIFLVSVMNERGISIREKVAEKPVIVRWALQLFMLLFLLIFGAYGIGYSPVDPIYAQF